MGVEQEDKMVSLVHRSYGEQKFASGCPVSPTIGFSFQFILFFSFFFSHSKKIIFGADHPMGLLPKASVFTWSWRDNKYVIVSHFFSEDRRSRPASAETILTKLRDREGEEDQDGRSSQIAVKNPQIASTRWFWVRNLSTASIYNIILLQLSEKLFRNKKQARGDLNQKVSNTAFLPLNHKGNGLLGFALGPVLGPFIKSSVSVLIGLLANIRWDSTIRMCMKIALDIRIIKKKPCRILLDVTMNFNIF